MRAKIDPRSLLVLKQNSGNRRLDAWFIKILIAAMEQAPETQERNQALAYLYEKIATAK